MSDFSTFLAMGGHGLYVWLSYAATALGLGGLTLLTWLTLRRRIAQLRRMESGGSDV